MTCQQCAQGTSTFAFHADKFRGRCMRIMIQTDNPDKELTTSEPLSAVCFSEGGMVKSCQAGEFIAISHARAQGWGFSKEDGICSRVLEILLTVAREGFGIDWIWLDAALNSGDPEKRLAPEEIDWVYMNARCTLVCDASLFTVKDATVFQKTISLLNSGWNTRLWTMQEAMLSKELWVLQKDYYLWSINDLVRHLVSGCERPRTNKPISTDAIRQITALVCHPDSRQPEDTMLLMLERVICAGRYRCALKPFQLVRALFPLFGIEYVLRSEDFLVAQTLLMQRLGEVGKRTISLFAPFGVPGSFSWAPLSLIGTKGPLASEIESVYPANSNHRSSGVSPLRGSRWLAVKVLPNGGALGADAKHDWAQALGTMVNQHPPTIRVTLELTAAGHLEGNAYNSSTERLPWAVGTDGVLWMLRPADTVYRTDCLGYYVVGRLLEKQETEKGEQMWKLQKVGVVECIVRQVMMIDNIEVLATWEEWLNID